MSINPPRMQSGATTAVLHFVAAGLVAAAVISAAAYLVVSRNAIAEATRNAQEIAAIDGRSIAGPALNQQVLAGDPSALSAFDRLIRNRVLSARVVRTKIWTPGGRIVYSDATALNGRVYPLGQSEKAALRMNTVVAEVSQLDQPENQFERGYGRLLEVYLPIRSAGGQTFLFETYQDYSTIDQDQRRIWSSFFPVLVAGIVLLLVVQVPLAWRLANELRRAERDREAAMKRALDASGNERRRIARDLHDGVVQTLAGVAFSLGAASSRTGSSIDDELASTLTQSSGAIRQAVRELRSMIIQIAPPELRGDRLESALGDLLAPLEATGIEVSLKVSGLDALDRESSVLLYRAAQEAIRNTSAHAAATSVGVVATALDGLATLEVRDNGRGFTAEEVIGRQREGHVGLAMLRSLVEDGGGELSVTSRPGSGSTVEVRLRAA